MLFGSEKNPKGPGWRRLRRVEKDLSGTRVAFRAPPLRLPPIPTSGREESQPDRLDINDPVIYTPKTYRLREDLDTEIDSAIHWTRAWSSIWNFSGLPYVHRGSVGELKLFVDVFHATDLPINNSLFRRADLVDFVGKYHRESKLSEYYKGSPEKSDPFDLTQYRFPEYLSPINSQWRQRNGAEWLYYEVQALHAHAIDEIAWLLPIGHQHCLSVRFLVKRRLWNAGNPYRLAQRSPITNYLRLMENIMDTMTVALSEEAQAEKSTIHNPEDEYPLPRCTEALIEEAKHSLYMASSSGYRAKDGNHRAPKEEVAAFIDQRLQPLPLPGCLAIDQPRIASKTASPDKSNQPELPARQ